MKKVKLTEVFHQWEGTAIVRNADGKLDEVAVGVAQSDKKLKEVGAKELFKNLPENLITLEVKKLDDVVISYVMDVEDFKAIAKVEDVNEELPTDEPVQA